MKEFIYLDTDYITSALAQINNGKLSKIIEEVGDSTQNSQTENSTSDKNKANFSMGIPGVLGINVANEKDLSDTQNTLSTIESAKQILTKTFDDNIYDLLINNLNDKKLITNNITEGNFVYLSDEFKIIDFNYLLKLLSDDFISLYTSSEPGTSLNREQQRNKSVKKAISDYNKNKKSEFEEIRKLISVMKSICPTETIFNIKNIVAPLKKEFLRASYSEIDFKYKGNIHVFAKITRKFAIENPDDKSEMFLHATNKLLPDLLNTFKINIDENTYIATPIAIYYE